MKQVLAACCLALLCGCATVMNRATSARDSITTDPYLCTSIAASMSCVIMFPQMMMPSGAHAFEPINIISIPMGL